MGVMQIIDGREVALDDSERQPVECWTRVMGYHRPVDSFNTGKKGEFAERLPFCTYKVERVLLAPHPRDLSDHAEIVAHAAEEVRAAVSAARVAGITTMGPPA